MQHRLQPVFTALACVPCFKPLFDVAKHFMSVSSPIRGYKDVVGGCCEEPLKYDVGRGPLNEIYDEVNVFLVPEGVKGIFLVKVGKRGVFYHLELVNF